MGLPVVRMGIDICSGHPAGPTYFPPRPAVTGAGTVFVEGVPVVRVNDEWAVHTNIISAHPSPGAGGSPTVYAEGTAIMRIGDPIACGSVCAMGSGTVFAD